MKKAQLNAISRSYAAKNEKEAKKLLQECKEKNIEVKIYMQAARQIRACQLALENERIISKQGE